MRGCLRSIRTSGVVSLVRAHNFDHEVKASYTFMVGATDRYGATTVAALVLNITDVSEGLSLPVQFAQPAVAGQVTMFMVRPAVDPESEPRTIIYQAEQTDGQPLPSWLALDSMTGEFTVAVEAEEGVWRIRVQAMVANAGGSQIAAAAGLPVALNEPAVASEREFVLAVAAAGNNLPDFASANRSFNLAENRQFTAGHSVGTAAANDDDTGDTLTYELRGADARPFAIGAGGALSISEDVTFDRESKEDYRFVVDVDDGRGGVASTEVEVMISNVNEAPEFLAVQEVYRVVGRTRSTVFVSPAVDLDEGDSLTYTASVPIGGGLTFDAARLRMTVAASAPLGLHPVTITATDEGGLQAQQEFMVDVQTAGNQVPAFAVALEAFEVMLSGDETMLVSGSEIGVIAASDADGHQLSYRIVSGAARFSIDPASGRITAAADLEPGVYRFTVEVNDGNGGTATVMVELAVQPAVPAGADQEDEVALMVIDRSIASAAAGIIRRRLDAPAAAPGRGLARSAGEGKDEVPPYMQMASAVDQWNDWRYDHESEADQIERMELRDYLYSRGFDFGLAGTGSQGAQLRLWGVGSRTSLDGNPEVRGEHVRYDGDTNLFMVGFEAGLTDIRMGLAAGRSKAKLALANTGARVTRQLNSIHPYLSFQASERVRLWATGSFGKGDFGRIDSDDSETGREARYVSAAGGFESSWDYRTLELSAGLNVLAVQSRLSGLAEQSLAESRHSFWRANIDFEAGRPFNVASELSFRPFVGAHIRRDGGDDWLDAHEIDATAGMSLNWSRGLSAEFTSRWQGNDGETNERNISGRVSYDFGSDGRGLLLSVTPSMSASGASEFSRSLQASAGYGLPVRLFADSGLVTVKADFSYTETSVADSYGFRFAGRRLDVDLSAAGDTYRLNLRIQ